MTAEELIKNKLYTTQDGEPIDVHDSVSSVKEVMIEFAKYHVEQALLKVANGDMDAICTWVGNPYVGDGSDSIDFDKVMKIYPLENIK